MTALMSLVALVGKSPECVHPHLSVLVEAIIRPPRDFYEVEDLGPKRFRAGNRVWQRKDLELRNVRGHISPP